MFEIVLTDKRTVLHPFFVYDISTNGKLTKHISTPLAKLSSTDRIDTITDRNYSIKIIELHFLFRFSPKPSVYDHFHSGNSRSFIQFPTAKDILQMLANGRNTNIKQCRHRFLRRPYSIVFIHHLDAILFALYNKDQKLCCTISYFKMFRHTFKIKHYFHLPNKR